jgi:3',5'-cyclic AMP phosphodiesterase CpdA
VRRIIHISDLHFGTEEPGVVEGLLVDIQQHPAHLLAVSGDLTQRARRGQFAAARAFLDRIALPRLIVPGNHDIPLYNVLARFGWPLHGYQRFITDDLLPRFQDEEIAVAGVNTARPNRWKDGCISAEQIEGLRQHFAAHPEGVSKVLVAHHPFIPPERDARAMLVEGAAQALRVLEACGCHIILAGHLHLAYVGDVRPHHVEIKRSILVVQAGTATSHRRRDEPNAYNILTLDGPRLSIDVRAWNGRRFVSTGVSEYRYDESGWSRAGVS